MYGREFPVATHVRQLGLGALVVLALVCPPAGATTPVPGPDWLWPLDDSAGAVARDHGGRLDAALLGDITWTEDFATAYDRDLAVELRGAGAAGRALSMGTWPELALTPDQAPDGFTVTMRVRLRAPVGGPVVLAWHGAGDRRARHWGLVLLPGGNLVGALFDAEGDARAVVTDGGLTVGPTFHLGFVYDGERTRLLVDGQPVAASAPHAWTSFSTLPAPLLVGGLGPGTTYDFPGVIDAVAIWRRALGPEQLAMVASTPANGWRSPPGLRWVPAATVAIGALADGATMGAAVAVSERVVVAGAPGDGAGTAWVVERQDGGGWRPVTGLVSAVATARFGAAVAVSGGRAAVAAPGDAAAFPGVVETFVRAADGAWPSESTIGPPGADPSLRFASAVGLDGDRLAIGAPGDGSVVPGGGAVHVLERLAGSAWATTSVLESAVAAPGDALGQAVAVDLDSIVAGGVGAGGIASRFDATSGGETVLPPGTPDPFGLFGSAVAVGDGVALVGSPGAGDLALLAGAAAVFERDVSGMWAPTVSLVADVPAAGALLGAAVATDGHFAMVGAPGDGGGRVHVFERNATGGWAAADILSPAAGRPGDAFGAAVALDGGTLVVGAPGADLVGPDTGAVSIWERRRVAPTLDVLGGGCPGPMILFLSQATPGGLVRPYGAFGLGASEVGATSGCRGRMVNLRDPIPLGLLRADADGRATVLIDVPAAGCGLVLHAIDLSNCTIGDLLQLR